MHNYLIIRCGYLGLTCASFIPKMLDLLTVVTGAWSQFESEAMVKTSERVILEHFNFTLNTQLVTTAHK